jgi:hypothetical protein
MGATIKRVAIILHGPPSVGKTEISKEIRKRHTAGTVRHISLDDGWLPDECRYSGGPSRYADSYNAQEPILVVELGCGEPSDLTFSGATRAAQEWVSVLQSSGRTLAPFLLWLEWSDAVARLKKRCQNNPKSLFCFWQQIGVYTLYAHRDKMTTFPTMAGFHEESILTSGRTIAEVADEIRHKAGL